MIRTKRYRFAAYIDKNNPVLSMVETDGKNSFVRFADFAAIASENERLREAGWMMFNIISPRIGLLPRSKPAVKEWLSINKDSLAVKVIAAKIAAAKEGRDAK